MAIFSLHHTWLGKSHTAYKPGVGRAHVNYITRESTCSKFFGERMPTDRQKLKSWLHKEELADRKNARVIDKVMVALPRELTPEEREQLIRDYCEDVTKGKASWAAAIHDQGKDAHNPHAHILFRDRDHKTGKRVMLTTERGSTDMFRAAWEDHANQALEKAGHEARIDRRSNGERGIESEPGIHVGPKNVMLEKKGIRPESEIVIEPKTYKPAETREIRYPEIDQGMTRFEANAAIRYRNIEAEQERQKARSASSDMPQDWTDRGGMVAQQRSALEWFEGTKLKTASRGPPQKTGRSFEDAKFKDAPDQEHEPEL